MIMNMYTETQTLKKIHSRLGGSHSNYHRTLTSHDSRASLSPESVNTVCRS